MKVLIYGYGNPGRQDDGLGVALVEQLEERAARAGVTHLFFDSNYQLNIEDSLDLRSHDLVIFADASMEEIDGFIVTRVEPSPEAEFTMHAVSPAFVLDVCRRLYGPPPPTYLLHIRGYAWELLEGCTPRALHNLEKAAEHIWQAISNPDTGLFEMEASLTKLKPFTVT